MTKRLLLMTGMVLLFACVVIIAWVKSHPTAIWPVKVVKVAGMYRNVGQSDLQKAMIPYVTNSFLLVDTKALQQHIMELPWVAAASVRRIWPNTLVVGVIEQQAVGRWNDANLLNAEGDIFTPGSTKMPAGIPSFKGPDGQQKMMLQEYRRLSVMLKPVNLHITEMDLSSRRAWNIVLNNGTTLVLGRTDIEGRMQRYINVYDRIFKEHPAISVDTRYRNGLAVQWQASA